MTRHWIFEILKHVKRKIPFIRVHLSFFIFKSTPAGSILLIILLSLAGLCFSSSGNAFESPYQESSSFRIEAHRWEEADKLFRSDSRWLGGDGAASVDLGHGRVLWLFGDSLIDLSGSGVRRTSDLVRNSIALQKGYDPASAEMQFVWKMNGNRPAAFFSKGSDHWFWPGSGIMVGNRLLIFLMEIKKARNPLGFDACGWKAVWIENPGETPDKWKLTYLKSPVKDGLIVGSGNPVLENGFLYVFAADNKDRAVCLVRWLEGSAITGTLTSPQWWAGEEMGWVGPEVRAAKPRPIIADGQMEFSVAYVPRLKSYLQVQTLSMANPCLSMSTAKALTGPWSRHACFFTPSEKGMPEILIYAGKSHPMLHGADMVFTYVVNTTREDRILNDMSIYFPNMIKGRIKTDRIPYPLSGNPPAFYVFREK